MRSGMTLAVYHATADVEAHVAALRRVRGVRLACRPQGRVGQRLAAADAVLWELAPGRKPAGRWIRALARGTPVVSYSADAGRELADLSRAAGFISHLRAPLRPVEVAHQLALVAPGDLATRLRQFQPTLRRHLGDPDVLADVVRATHAPVDPAAVAEALVSRAAAWLPVPTVAVVAGEASREARVLAGRQLDEAMAGPAVAFGSWVARAGTPTGVADLAAHRASPGGPAVAALGWPLVSRGRPVGALVAFDGRGSARAPLLGAATANALRRVLEAAALALDNALRIERAEALSVTDDLTDLYNARYLTLVLRRETKRASRSGRPLSLLFIDLDGFKNVNDVHGHLYGSRTLIEAGSVIRGCARETDIVARYGGDEFTVVLPDTGGSGAAAVAQRVRDRIATHPFLADERLNVRLTASVGVATLPDVATSATGLLEAADRAMYRVKDRGKNGVEVAGSDGGTHR